MGRWMQSMWSVRAQTVMLPSGVRIDLHTTEGGRRCMDIRAHDGQAYSTHRVVFADDGSILRIRELTAPLTPAGKDAI